MFFFFFNNLFLFCDAPEAFQFGPQDPAIAITEGMLSLHNYLMFFVIVIGTVVMWMLYYSIKNFDIEFNRIFPLGILIFVQTVLMVVIFFLQLKETASVQDLKSKNIEFQSCIAHQEKAMALTKKIDIVSSKLDDMIVCASHTDSILFGLYGWATLSTIAVITGLYLVGFYSPLLLKCSASIGLKVNQLLTKQDVIGAEVSELVVCKRELISEIQNNVAPLVESVVNTETLPVVISLVTT